MMKTMMKHWLAAIIVACSTSLLAQAPAPQSLESLAWLEEVNSGRALDWVQAQDKRARTDIEAMPGYAARYKATLDASTSGNISEVNVGGGYLYNFTQNARNPRGLWRRTTLESYRTLLPVWEPLLDLDELSRKENRRWAFAGIWREPTQNKRAIVALSDAGKDEVELREFDIESRSFVQAGFYSPPAKQRFAWAGPDALMIATDFPGAAGVQRTTSGYAAQMRLWQRGTALAQAPLISQVPASSVNIGFSTYDLPVGHAVVSHNTKFHEAEYSYWDGNKLTPIALPPISWAWASNGYIVSIVRQPWEHRGKSYAAGSVFAARAEQIAKGIQEFHLLYEPPAKGRPERTEAVANGFVVLAIENMNPVLRRAIWNGNGFNVTSVNLPLRSPFSFAGISYHNSKEDHVWLRIESPIEPRQYGLLNTATGQFDKMKSQRDFFDGDKYVVERFEARSHDGVMIPYTMIRAKDKPASPAQPTLLYGYGGFGTSLDMNYQRDVGINWLSHGGVYVMAHIRGGGEFGEAWRVAALREKRHNSYRDFMAVAEDLTARGFTTPKRLGIYGASNGGVLVSTVMAQKPELFGAVVSRVPLTDMVGFIDLFAGLSWIDEDGDPRIPADREHLLQWSPLHNLKPGVKYPPTLLVGNRNDDRVHPAHARKFAHRLQEFGQPAWIVEAAEGGHSGRTTGDLFATREATLYTFLMHVLMR
jgi:prolyl oligopeptidase